MGLAFLGEPSIFIRDENMSDPFREGDNLESLRDHWMALPPKLKALMPETNLSYYEATNQMHCGQGEGGSKFTDPDVKNILDVVGLRQNLVLAVTNRVDDRAELIAAGAPENAFLPATKGPDAPEGLPEALYFKVEGVEGRLGVIKLGELHPDTRLLVRREKGKSNPEDKKTYAPVSFTAIQGTAEDMPKTNFATVIVGRSPGGSDELWTVHPGSPVRPVMGEYSFTQGLLGPDELATGEKQPVRVMTVEEIKKMAGLNDSDYVKIIPGDFEDMTEKYQIVLEHERSGSETRDSRVKRLRAAVLELFPGEEAQALRENIDRSFQVPQFGDYHNEGIFMDSHLDLILKQIDQVEQSKFPEALSLSTREALQRAALQDKQAVRQYVFLHDISKADCLTLKFGEEDRVLTWDEWQEMLAQSILGKEAQNGDEKAFRAFCEEQGITGISYFQNQGEIKRQHGKTGADELRQSGLVAHDAMLAAIEAHEVAYSFSRINVKTYESFFGDMASEARDFALLASYVDTMSSLRSDGNPDLTNFLALAGSREKFESLVLLEERLRDVKIDKQKFVQAWAALRASPEALTSDMIESMAEKLLKECRIAGYDVDRLRILIEPLVENGTLTADERERLLETAKTDPQSIGRTFGSKMRFLTPVLKQALV